LKNIINEKPSHDLHGRLLYSVQFVDNADIRSKELLDIGCGYGWFEMNALVRGCLSIVGIEQTEQDLSTAKDAVQDNRVIFKTGDATNLQFEDGVFDTVVSWEVLEHIPRHAEQSMFHEASRVLRKGGCFYLSTPHRSLISNAFDPAWWIANHRHYTLNEVKSFAQLAGFEIECCEVRGAWWELVGINNLYVSKWLFRRPPIFAAAVNRLTDREYARPDGFTNIFLKLRKR
jgi:SAM-dependent methyltransferase